MYEKLKKIETELSGNEFYEHGVSYCIGFDKLELNIPLKLAVKKQLLEYKAIDELEELILEEIIDYKSDINCLFQEWHLDGIANGVIEALDDNLKVYKFSENTEIGYSYGSNYSIFRIIEGSKECILAELYIMD